MSTGQGQQNLRMFGVMPPLRTFAPAELRACKSLRDAYRMTVQFSNRPRKAIEEESGLSTSHLSRILEGSRTLPARCHQSFYEACGNVYALQWQLFNLGFDVVRRDPHSLTVEEKAALWDAQQMRQAG